MTDTATVTETSILTSADPLWPFPADYDEAPRQIWARGDLEALAGIGDAIAIVGARAATAYGETVAADLAFGLAEAGRPVLTTTAYGIAAAALRGALAADSTPPIVWQPCGIERTHPVAHTRLAENVVDAGGVILTSAAPDRLPSIAAFSESATILGVLPAAVVVVEAGVRSSSRSTAHIARKMGRRALAVPGPVTSTMSSGCHSLIQSGTARLVTSTADVIRAIGR
ncbi:DNA-processing protein DprA [Mobilicoccus pelagius]|uniref:DNA protecting protein DprA n=1 Tax=Mobilicoccus pelagius NBRC 104925 TaxID=1089455 RepID=H5UUB5_9MICO|nr:DNA-processing protein DprA [Mobilicoccus pelagius]GAB49323.1 DNA protecting protein DprA [Mobilicoccus pelagius NBRC 104925]